MNEFYQGLRFERPNATIMRRLIPIGVGIGFFLLAWEFVPDRVLFWMLLIAIVGLTWAASFGGRQVLGAVHDFIHRIERI